MKSIWIPHIPKNAGTTIIDNIKNFCTSNSEKFKDTTTLSSMDAWLDKKQKLSKKYKFVSRDTKLSFKQFLNIKNNTFIRLDHDNPLEQEMKDWLKILIVRHPLDRYISWYNTINAGKTIIYNDTSSYKLTEHISFDDFLINLKLYFKPRLQLKYISFKQNLTDKPLVDQITIKNIKNIFDHIVDIKNIDNVLTLIEDNFLDTKINWPNLNTAKDYAKKLEQDGKKYKLLEKENLSNYQLNNIYSLPEFNEDLEFYNYVTQ